MKRLLLLVGLALASRAAAQMLPSYTDVNGETVYFTETVFRGRIVDSLSREPLPSAVISVITSPTGQRMGTVRNFVTDKKGEFRFECHADAQNRMEISFLGYKLRTVLLDADTPECNLGTIVMAEDATAIDRVVVKARMEMFRMKGDTTIYLPQSVKTMEGDKALEILRQMPGVEVADDGSVTVLGESVSRTYVNDKLLFGEDPRTALKQLDAAEVATIQAYDEAVDTATDSNSPKRKVLNVVTFKKFAKSLSATALAEGGVDFSEDAAGERPARYQIKGEAGYFSEKLQVQASGGTDTRAKSDFRGIQPGSRHATHARASIGGAPNRKHHYNVNYYYDNDRTRTWTASRQEYFPTDLFHSQQVADTTSSYMGSRQHYVTGDYRYQTEKWTVTSGFSGTFSAKEETERLLQQTVQDEKPLSKLARQSALRADGSSYSGGLGATRRFAGKHVISLNGWVSKSDKRSDRLRHENQFTDAATTATNLELFGSNPSTTLTGKLAYTLDEGAKGSFTFGTEMRYENNDDEIEAFDPATGQLNRSLSEQRTDRSLQWSPQASYSLRSEKHSVSFDAGYEIHKNSYRDRLDATPEDRRLFHAPTFGAFYNYSDMSSGKRFSIMFMNRMNTPGGKLLSSRIDDRSPMNLSTGNPTLKAQEYYNIQVEGSLMGKSQSSVAFFLKADLWTDSWLTEYRIFEQDTPLREYHGYVAPAGSALSRFVNGGTKIRARAGVDYKTRIAPLRCFIQLSGKYSYENLQAMDQDRKGRTHDHLGEIEVGVTTNISSDFRIVLKSSSQYRWYKNIHGYTERGFRECLSANLRWDFLGSMVFTSTYAMDLYRSPYEAADRNDHILNFSLGCRLLKRMGTLSFNAYDILNRNSGLSVGQSNLFTRYTWQRMHSGYFTFAFEYKFKNLK